ncbi:DNA binding, ATP binding protein [Tanacetum coccineum]|uniref:DNA binding, ATP binding protein n=1 Tax=Tanacetum coccineum TaxID=301880 RepID=A0ABQ5ASG8_9ASTR
MQIASEKMVFIIDLIKLSHDAPTVIDSCLIRIFHSPRILKHGYMPPSESVMLDSSIGHLLQKGSVLVDIPLVDIKFYRDDIKSYKEELKAIGVEFENKDACEFIGERLMSIAASSKLTRDRVLSILKFIQFLG